MQLIECEYVGLEDSFTKIRVKIKIEDQEVEGFICFENDGRDAELGGDLENYEFDWNEFYTDSNLRLLEPEIEKGYAAWEAGM